MTSHSITVVAGLALLAMACSKSEPGTSLTTAAPGFASPSSAAAAPTPPAKIDDHAEHVGPMAGMPSGMPMGHDGGHPPPNMPERR